MSSYPLVICFKHPFQIKPYLLCKIGDKFTVTRNARYIYRFNGLICYGCHEIVADLRGRRPRRLPPVIDVVTAKKLLVGHPKADFRSGKEPWTLRRILGNKVRQETLKWLNDIDQLKTAAPEENPSFPRIVEDLLTGFEEAWKEMNEELDSSNEAERFFTIEVPIYNLFLHTQLKGVPLSQKKLNDKLIELTTRHYSAVKELELKYGFVSQRIPGCKRYDDIKEFCSLPNTGEEINSDFWRYVDLYSEYDPFLHLLTEARYSGIDYAALLRYSTTSQRKVYPEFDVMGTVTGRILIAKPGIQYLKKTSRDVFVPSEGNSFVYADFDQFEPGIAAHLSGDEKLIRLYNQGDVYSALSEVLFGNKERRKLAKIMFLAFMYGISSDRLESLILNTGGDESLKKQGMAFLNEFKTLRDWKNHVCFEAKEKGFTSSFLGNRRYLRKKGELTEKEKRWVPNQIIQGTASYIFKKALLALREEMKTIEFHIPMHDAILLETETDREDQVKEIVERIFSETFSSVCPDIKPGVSFDLFAE